MAPKFEHPSQEPDPEFLLRIFPGGFDDEPSTDAATHKTTYSSERLREQHEAMDGVTVQFQEPVVPPFNRRNIGYPT